LRRPIDTVQPLLLTSKIPQQKAADAFKVKASATEQLGTRSAGGSQR
jgi:hypothetical protein